MCYCLFVFYLVCFIYFVLLCLLCILWYLSFYIAYYLLCLLVYFMFYVLYDFNYVYGFMFMLRGVYNCVFNIFVALILHLCICLQLYFMCV